MKTISNRAGQTIVEIAIVSFVTILIGAVSGSFLQTLIKGQRGLLQKTQINAHVSQAYEFVMKVGRYSGGTALGGCVTPNTSTLRCDVFANPYGGNVTMQLRHDPASKSLVFETGAFPLPSPTPLFQERYRYNNISDFLVCDYEALDAIKVAFNAGTLDSLVSSCKTILPVELSNEFIIANPRPLLPAVPSNRFIRFQVTGTSSSGTVDPGMPLRPTVFQGAFFVRNPDPIGQLLW